MSLFENMSKKISDAILLPTLKKLPPLILLQRIDVKLKERERRKKLFYVYRLLKKRRLCAINKIL